jgi:hypothetical protein
VGRIEAEGKSLGMFDGLDGQVDIELRPVKVIGGWLSDVQDFANGCVGKPGKLREWQKQFPATKIQPKAKIEGLTPSKLHSLT